MFWKLLMAIGVFCEKLVSFNIALNLIHYPHYMYIQFLHIILNSSFCAKTYANIPQNSFILKNYISMSQD